MIDELKADVSDIGEVHATVEEHDKELEIRDGQVRFDDSAELMVFDVPGHPVTKVPYSRIVDWYEPDELWH